MKHVHGFSDYNGTRTYNHLVGKWTLNQLAQLALNDWAVLWVRICTAHLTVCSYHVTHAFQSQSILYICLNVKELLTQNRRDIWCLSDCNELSACGFESRCSYLNFRYRACFEQGVPWHWGKYRMWISSETPTWHDKNIQPYWQLIKY